jgi:hypothetical protein
MAWNTRNLAKYAVHVHSIYHTYINTLPLLASHSDHYSKVVAQSTKDENGSDTDGYHLYHICFHISGRIRIRVRIVSAMPDRYDWMSTS